MSNDITHQDPTTEAIDRGLVFTPPVDIFENEDEILLVADLPGVAKDNLHVNLEKRELSLEGRMTAFPEGWQPTSEEYRAGTFSRTFRVPQAVDEERIRAELKNGMLTLHLPKRAESKPREISVQVS